jgi:hypothetical protein
MEEDGDDDEFRIVSFMLLILEIAGASGGMETTLHLIYVLISFSTMLEQDPTTTEI